jgi:hypothetical protein
MSRARRYREGQAEIIGAIIATGVMILAITAMFYSIVRLQQSTSDVYAKRIAFESERTLEKISVNYDPNSNTCRITNMGGIDITVARVWITNTEFKDPSEVGFQQVIKRGESINSYTLDNAPVAIVTTRGNVFEIKSECEKQAVTGIIYITASGLISSQNIIGTTRLTSDKACIEYSLTPSPDGVPVLVYKNDTGWIYHNCTHSDQTTYGWKIITNPSQNTINFDADLDKSTVNEAIVAINKTEQTGNKVEYKLKDPDLSIGEKNDITLELLLYNITRLTNATDTVTIFYKFVVRINGNAPPHQVSYNPRVALVSLDSNIVYAAPGAISVMSTSSSSGEYIGVISGYVVFPRYFYNFQSSYYSVNITLEIANPTSAVRITSLRLEYIAITGADILWIPLPQSQ